MLDVLHYIENNQQCNAGDLISFDVMERRTKTHKDTDNFLVTVGDVSVKQAI
jgi:hypothetical protein